MKQGLKLLILAGSSEARALALATQRAGAVVRAVVSEPPRGPNRMPVPFDLIDFDDAKGVSAAFAGYDAVLDASHGFDPKMSHLGFEFAQKLDMPHLCFSRPIWPVDGQERWKSVCDVTAGCRLIGPDARVFSATGWASLPQFATFVGARLFLRQTTRHDRPAPFDFVELAFGDPPFSVASEMALFQALKIDTLICRNLGGLASRPKLDAAAKLALNVILIDRPALPSGARVVETIDAALDWVTGL